MKRILVMVTTILWTANLVSAGSIQIRPIIGYGSSINQNRICLGDGEYSISYDMDVSSSGEITELSTLYNPSGTGMNIGLGILYTLDQNIGIELACGYLMGEEKQVVSQGITYAGWGTQTNIYNKSDYISIDLTMKIFSETGGYYVGFGPSLAVGGKTIATIEAKSTTVTEKEWEYTYKTGIGWNATLGKDYNISDKMSLSLGLVLHNMTLKLNKGKLTKFTIAGVDKLEDLKTNQKEIEFKEDASYDPSATVDDPTIKDTISIPLSSLAISVGITYRF